MRQRAACRSHHETLVRRSRVGVLGRLAHVRHGLPSPTRYALATTRSDSPSRGVLLDGVDDIDLANDEFVVLAMIGPSNDVSVLDDILAAPGHIAADIRSNVWSWQPLRGTAGICALEAVSTSPQVSLQAFGDRGKFAGAAWVNRPAGYFRQKSSAFSGGRQRTRSDTYRRRLGAISSLR